MPGYTEHYNLIKPNKTDNYNVDVANTNNDVIDGELYKKVEKIPGKGLSTNDFTDAYKNRLDDLKIPTNNNELINGAGYLTGTQVSQLIQLSHIEINGQIETLLRAAERSENDLLSTKQFIANSMKTLSAEGTSIHVEDSADYPCSLRVEGKSEQQQNEVDYPEITMSLDSESGNYYLDGITTQDETPSPDNVVDFVNTYPAGNYKTTINDKTYVITLNDDLRSITKGTTTADRLWLDTSNVKAWVDKKIYMQVFSNPNAWTLFGGQEYRFGANWQDSQQSLFARCNYFEEIPNSELGTNIGMYTLNSAYLRVSYPGKTLEEFKEWITEKNESGKPLMAIFTLRFPVENLIQQTCYEWNVPSPNNKIDIENVSGDLKVKVDGKNLFNPNGNINDSFPDYAMTGTNTYENGVLTTTAKINGRGVGYRIPVKVGDIVRFSAKCINFGGGINGVLNICTDTKTQKTQYINTLNQTTTNTYTVAAGVKEIICTFITNVGSSGNAGAQFTEIMITVNDEDTTYVPYQGEQTVTFPFVEGQKLMKDGYLGDDGIHNKRKQYIFTGNETLLNYGSTDEYLGFAYVVGGVISNNVGFCNFFKLDAGGAYNKNANSIWIASNNGNGIFRFSVDKNVASTLAEAKSWLAEQYSAGTPVIVEYEMQEEETTAYTSEQQTAYNNLQKLKTYRTVTNISNSQDTNMQLTYKMDLQTQIAGGGSSA